VWNAVWVTVGWRLGDQWTQAERWSERVETVLLVLLAVGVVVVIGRRVRANRRAAGLAADPALRVAEDPSPPAPAGSQVAAKAQVSEHTARFEEVDNPQRARGRQPDRQA
jgi:hypothetical protein